MIIVCVPTNNGEGNAMARQASPRASDLVSDQLDE